MNRFLLILSLGLLVSVLACSPTSKSERQQADQGFQENNFTLQEMLVNGQKQYHLRGCIKCHGRTGAGDGYRSLSLPPEQAPRDFRDLGSYLQGSDLNSITFTIRNGITNLPPVGRKGLMRLFSTNVVRTSGMPSYPHLTDEEITHIAYYVMYLQTNY